MVIMDRAELSMTTTGKLTSKLARVHGLHWGIVQESHGNRRLVEQRIEYIRRAIPCLGKTKGQNVENVFDQS